jgi:hypothetical protein
VSEAVPDETDELLQDLIDVQSAADCAGTVVPVRVEFDTALNRHVLKLAGTGAS